MPPLVQLNNLSKTKKNHILKFVPFSSVGKFSHAEIFSQSNLTLNNTPALPKKKEKKEVPCRDLHTIKPNTKQYTCCPHKKKKKRKKKVPCKDLHTIKPNTKQCTSTPLKIKKNNKKASTSTRGRGIT
jgi:hypothetical protein